MWQLNSEWAMIDNYISPTLNNSALFYIDAIEKLSVEYGNKKLSQISAPILDRKNRSRLFPVAHACWPFNFVLNIKSSNHLGVGSHRKPWTSNKYRHYGSRHIKMLNLVPFNDIIEYWNPYRKERDRNENRAKITRRTSVIFGCKWYFFKEN